MKPRPQGCAVKGDPRPTRRGRKPEGPGPIARIAAGYFFTPWSPGPALVDLSLALRGRSFVVRASGALERGLNPRG